MPQIQFYTLVNLYNNYFCMYHGLQFSSLTSRRLYGTTWLHCFLQTPAVGILVVSYHFPFRTSSRTVISVCSSRHCLICSLPLRKKVFCKDSFWVWPCMQSPSLGLLMRPVHRLSVILCWQRHHYYSLRSSVYVERQPELAIDRPSPWNKLKGFTFCAAET
jgi:hypothetical protein